MRTCLFLAMEVRYIMVKISPSEITPEHIYLSRRKFMVGIGALAAGSLISACSVKGFPTPPATSAPTSEADVAALKVGPGTDELGDPLTSMEAITNYNNYYEFSLDKQAVASKARDFKTSPWQVEVGGLVHKPRTFDVDDLLGRFSQEERIYRMRCVEGWSMVIPWQGFRLADLLKEVEPMSEAKYVRFETLYDPEQMPGQKSGWYTWPYAEGLALRRGAAHRRGDARSDAAGYRAVRQVLIATKRGAAAAGGTLEVWLQEHQVHRED
jgi:sulfoxide reductase catalytic subunit YedY